MEKSSMLKVGVVVAATLAAGKVCDSYLNSKFDGYVAEMDQESQVRAALLDEVHATGVRTGKVLEAQTAIDQCNADNKACEKRVPDQNPMVGSVVAGHTQCEAVDKRLTVGGISIGTGEACHRLLARTSTVVTVPALKQVADCSRKQTSCYGQELQKLNE